MEPLQKYLVDNFDAWSSAELIRKSTRGDLLLNQLISMALKS